MNQLSSFFQRYYIASPYPCCRWRLCRHASEKKSLLRGRSHGVSLLASLACRCYTTPTGMNVLHCSALQCPASELASAKDIFTVRDIFRNHILIANFLVQNEQGLVVQRDHSHKLPLFYACQSLNIVLVQLLLHEGRSHSLTEAERDELMRIWDQDTNGMYASIPFALVLQHDIQQLLLASTVEDQQ
eukprot:m.250977 g.250977  ORF g.250977 m.250977 type:complete len:187 (-) comp17181_c8_seq4:366-926(-)